MYQEKEDRIAAYLSGNMPEQERILFLKDIASNPSLKNDYLVYKEIWELTKQLSHSKETTENDWNDLQQRGVTPMKRYNLNRWNIAASVALIAVISVSMWFFGSTDISFTTKQKVMEYRLVDNSTILMHHNSTLSYGTDFNDLDRTVALRGAAYFDIEKCKKPFTVHTDNGDITVYGTQFTAFSHENFLVVELHEGAVSVLSEGIDYKLTPGERFFSDGASHTVSAFTKASSWSGNLELTDVPLAYILNQLELTYGISSDVNGRWLKENYTVKLPKNDLMACLTILNDVVGKNFALKNQTIVLN